MCSGALHDARRLIVQSLQALGVYLINWKKATHASTMSSAVGSAWRKEHWSPSLDSRQQTRVSRGIAGWERQQERLLTVHRLRARWPAQTKAKSGRESGERRKETKQQGGLDQGHVLFRPRKLEGSTAQDSPC